MALITFEVSHPSNIDVLPLKRKELREYMRVYLFHFGGELFPLPLPFLCLCLFLHLGFISQTLLLLYQPKALNFKKE
jgi:hypothetical protein